MAIKSSFIGHHTKITPALRAQVLHLRLDLDWTYKAISVRTHIGVGSVCNIIKEYKDAQKEAAHEQEALQTCLASGDSRVRAVPTDEE